MPHTLPAIPLLVFVLVAAVITLYLLSRRGLNDAGDERRASDTLRTALHVKQAGNYQAAEELLRSVAASMNNSSDGAFSLRTSILQHLAHCCSQNGKYEDSRMFYGQLLDLWKKGLLRPTAEILTDIDYSAATGEFGTSTESVAELYTLVIEAKRQLYGPAHMEVIHSMNARSHLLQLVGRLDEAKALESEVEALKDLMERHTKGE